MLSEECRQNRQSQGYAKDGPLLAALLKAEQEAGTLPHHPPLKTLPGAFVPAAGGFAGVCAKEGCGLRAGGRGSRTHCCRRCEKADLHGVPRLNQDPGPGPTTGEPWKKAHGPECTGHADRKMRPPVPPRQMPYLPEFVTPVPPSPPPHAAPEAYTTTIAVAAFVPAVGGITAHASRVNVHLSTCWCPRVSFSKQSKTKRSNKQYGLSPERLSVCACAVGLSGDPSRTGTEPKSERGKVKEWSIGVTIGVRVKDCLHGRADWDHRANKNEKQLAHRSHQGSHE